MRILFIKLRHIGDSLLLTPTIAATKKKYPHAEIWVLVRETCDGILAGCPEIDRILTTANPDSAKRSKLGWLSDLKLAALLRRTHFDFVFELTDNDRARFLALAARTPMRCTNEHPTLKKFWRPFFHRICTTPRYPKHQVIRDYVCPEEILELPTTPGPLVFAATCSIPWHDLDYKNRPPFAVLHIHTRWPQKSWPIERWEALIPLLLEMVPQIILSCGPGAEEVLSSRMLSEKIGPRLITTAGTTSWSQLAWLLEQANFFVGVDTAAMHLAAACGCPTVALFGPSPTFEYYPWEVTHWLIQPETNNADSHVAGDMRDIALASILKACKDANECHKASKILTNLKQISQL
jgi:heptosyltransferase-3